ncbi:hypothetical protein ACJ5M8_002842 [Vibrio antiquarius]
MMTELDKLSQRATDGTFETDGSSKLWGTLALESAHCEGSRQNCFSNFAKLSINE